MNSPIKKPITVLVADDHSIVREGIRTILDLEADINVVGEADSGKAVIELAQKLCPDIILMDIAMPLMNGIEATRQLKTLLPETKILVLSAHSDDAYVHKMVELGVRGYLIKQNSFKILITAIREVAEGKTFFSPHITRQFGDPTWKSNQSEVQPLKKRVALTSRETEVLQLIAEGKANKQIASILEISIKTIEKHRQNLMAKLNLHDTAGLTRYAISAGVIENSVQSTVL